MFADIVFVPPQEFETTVYVEIYYFRLEDDLFFISNPNYITAHHYIL